MLEKAAACAPILRLEYSASLPIAFYTQSTIFTPKDRHGRGRPGTAVQPAACLKPCPMPALHTHPWRGRPRVSPHALHSR
jgi:hypothetical protein